MPRKQRTRYSDEFAAYVTARRAELNLSQAEFGRHFGVSGSYVSGWETQSRVPARELLVAGAQSLGEDPAVWLSAAGYDATESTYTVGPVVRDASARERLDEAELPQVGEVGEDGLIELSAKLEGTSMYLLMVVSESLGRFRRGDRLVISTDGKAKKGRHVLLKEPDGTIRLVRLARVGQDHLEVYPLSALGQTKPVRVCGEVIGVAVERRESL